MMTKTTSNPGERLAAAVSLGLGVAVVFFTLSISHKPKTVDVSRKYLAVSATRTVGGLRMRAKPAAPVAVPLPIQTAAAPAEKPLLKRVRPPATSAPTPVTEAPQSETPVAEAPVIEASANTLTQQPGLPVSVPAPLRELPQMPGQPPSPVTAQPIAASNATNGPAAPPDDYAPPAMQYLEKPGGNVLVIGLLVDDTGVVLDSKILVPSYSALGDISYLMVSRQNRITDMTPPLAPGEKRWLEVRVTFPDENPSLLP